MKRIFIFIAMVAAATLYSNSAEAQNLRIGPDGFEFGEETQSNKTTTFHYAIGPRDNKFYIGSKTYIPTFEIGWNMLTAPDYSAYEGKNYGDFMDINNWKSTQVTVNLFGASAHSRNREFGVDVALGIRANNYRFDSSMTLSKEGGLVYPVAIEGRVKKSKLNTAAIHVPLEVWVGRPSKFAFSLGGFVDMTMASHTKIKFKGGSKDKIHNYPVNFIQAGATARITMFGFSIYGQYTPTQLFKTGRGPQVQQWTIGIGL